MTPRFRDSALVLFVAGLIVAGLYLAAVSQSRIDRESLTLSPETERLREELVKLSSDLDATSLEGRACRASLAGLLYELRKDSMGARVALAERVQRQVLDRTVFGAALGFGVATLILGIALLAAAARGSDGDAGSAGRPQAVWSGAAALAASAVAFAVLAALPGPAGPTPAGAPTLTLDMAAFVDRCEDYRRKEE